MCGWIVYWGRHGTNMHYWGSDPSARWWISQLDVVLLPFNVPANIGHLHVAPDHEGAGQV